MAGFSRPRISFLLGDLGLEKVSGSPCLAPRVCWEVVTRELISFQGNPNDGT